MQHIANTLAMAITAGRIAEEHVVRRMVGVLGKRWRWLRPLAKRLETQFGNRLRPRQAMVVRWIMSDAGFRRAMRKHDISVAGELLINHEMCPASGAPSLWDLPPITSVGELAEWCDVPVEELEWLADRGGREVSTLSKYRRYRYRVLSKGLRRFRLIEVPIYRVKSIQRRLLAEMVNRMQPHEASHGFRIGRSIHTFAAQHVGREVVLKMDLKDFFPTIGVGRVSYLFRLAGYPEEVADLLAALATNTVPDDIWQESSRMPAIYSVPHLPQGAPSSPAIANLCAHKLDRRLSGLSASCGATYSRYADDLAFSGDAEFARCVERVQHHIAAIVMDEGFRVNFRKTRIMRASARQRVTGLIVNQRANVDRREYKRLQATLHNCIRDGLESQNRDGHSDFRAHLVGRVSFVETVNPQRGQRLREMLERIQ